MEFVKVEDLVIRVWHRKQKKIYYISEMNYRTGAMLLVETVRFKDYNPIYAIRPEVDFMRKMGPCDKNKKDIWEGDFVKWDSGRVQEVTYPEFIIDIYHCDWQTDACEIIGNIYKNPELLTGEKI